MSRSTPNLAASATISAFFILASADLDNVVGLIKPNSADEFSETFSDESADLRSSLEKKPFFFVSFVSLIS